MRKGHYFLLKKIMHNYSSKYTHAINLLQLWLHVCKNYSIRNEKILRVLEGIKYIYIYINKDVNICCAAGAISECIC